MLSYKSILIIFLIVCIFYFIIVLGLPLLSKCKSKEHFSNINNTFGIKCLIKDIDVNKKKQIPDFKLTHIDCRTGKCGSVTYIMDYTFSLFRNLEIINFINKDIEILHSRTFSGCEHLKEVSLLHNPLRMIGSELLRDNLNVIDDESDISNLKLKFSISIPTHENNDTKYKNIISDKITIVLFDETIEHINQQLEMNNKQITTHSTKQLDIGLTTPINLENELEIYKFIIHTDSLRTSVSNKDKYKQLVYFCLGIDIDLFDNFRMYLDDNNEYSPELIQKHFEFVYYKDIIYSTDMGVWRSQFVENNMYVDSTSPKDDIIDICCLDTDNTDRFVCSNSNLLKQISNTRYVPIIEIYKFLFGLMLVNSDFNLDNIYLDQLVESDFSNVIYPEPLPESLNQNSKLVEKAIVEHNIDIFKTIIYEIKCVLNFLNSHLSYVKQKALTKDNKLRKFVLVYHNLIKHFNLLDKNVYTKCGDSINSCNPPPKNYIVGCTGTDTFKREPIKQTDPLCTISVIDIPGSSSPDTPGNNDGNLIKCISVCKKYNLDPEFNYSIYILSESDRFSRLAVLIQCIRTMTVFGVHSNEYDKLSSIIPSMFLMRTEQENLINQLYE